MQALIGELCREKRIDLLQVEFSHLAHFRDAAPNVPAILVEHDLTFTLYRQFALQEGKRRARAEFERWLAYERQWLRSYDGVWTMSETDREQAVEQGSPAEATFVVGNGVDVERYRPCEEPADCMEILYVGSFRHKPNAIGFDRMRREIMPRVWKRFPKVRLRVVAGPDPESYWKGRQDTRIRLHGFVDDLRPLYARATAVAVPLLVSAGTNIKVMEAMACGKAVVSTPVGCEGLDLVDGSELLIRADSATFAAAVSDLLADDCLRIRIGRQARAAAEQRFSWKQIAESAWISYQVVARR
jgi:glycosyltransferase involved in cell wall biosynthesis